MRVQKYGIYLIILLLAALDYEAAMFTLTFVSGVRGPHSICKGIKVFDDELVENDDKVTVMAAFVQNMAGISLVSNSASTTIIDNDCKYILSSFKIPSLLLYSLRCLV